MEIIIGAVVSCLVQFVKKYWGTSEYWTLGIVVVVSLVAAGIYTYLTAAGYWQAFAQVLITAGAFYTFIIARFGSSVN
jgi:hypothetical protein